MIKSRQEVKNEMSTFGENIKELRKSRGYTQDKFAKVIGSNQVNVSAWEVGTRVPTLATIRHIADTFKIPLSSLISLEDSGMEDDYVREIADMLQRDPKVRMLFDKARFMSSSDLDAVLGVVNAITRERGDDA